jgi:hypothetical protein
MCTNAKQRALHKHFPPESARNHANQPLATMQNGGGNHASRVRINRILLIYGHFFSLLAELVDTSFQ